MNRVSLPFLDLNVPVQQQTVDQLIAALVEKVQRFVSGRIDRQHVRLAFRNIERRQPVVRAVQIGERPGILQIQIVEPIVGAIQKPEAAPARPDAGAPVRFGSSRAAPASTGGSRRATSARSTSSRASAAR